LDNPNDFVRVEVAAALQREIPVIPILLEATRVPSANQLPEDIQELSLRSGVFVHHSSFHDDMDRLIRGLGLQSGRTDEQPMAVLAKETMPREGRVIPQKPAEPVSAKPAEPAKAPVSTRDTASDLSDGGQTTRQEVPEIKLSNKQVLFIALSIAFLTGTFLLYFLAKL
jgi:hypothetical protein